jgi:RNA polymerase sigma factor (TIGR02999 family)
MNIPTDITQLLQEASSGNRTSADQLYAQVYDELHQIAHHRLSKHRPGATLNTTALVHEAYLRLVDQQAIEWQDRAHFFAVASRAMRFIIIDYARKWSAQKRGGHLDKVALRDVQIGTEERVADLLTLNDALDELATVSERQSQLVEYRFFGGLTYKEIAEVTGWSVPTVKRDWQRARTWLYRAIQAESDAA